MPTTPMTEAGVLSGGRFQARSELLARGAQAGAGLRALGIASGDSVALLLRNQATFFEAWLATSTIGASAVPLNWHNSKDEIDYILGDCDAKAVVADADLALTHRAGFASRLLLVVGDAGGQDAVRRDLPKALDWARWLEQHDPLPSTPAPTAPTLVYSSGTTGVPKGIRRLPRSADQTAAYARIARIVYGIEPGMRTVITAPLYHSAPLYHGTAALLAGGTLVVQARFDAAELVALVERYRITNLMLVPTMFIRLLQLPESVRLRHDLSSLRHVIHGAAPCPPDVKQRMIEWLGPIIHEYYGCTESGIVTSCNSKEWIARPGTVGRPVEGGTVAILDELGRRLPPGTPGEIYVRNPSSADFTYHKRDNERLEVERDGLITCGDLGYVDSEGYLYLLDRKKDMVISGGVNIYPAEIEARLLKIDGITDCAVFGIPDRVYGEALAALVTIAPGANLEPSAIQAQLAADLGRLKVPKLVEVRDHLPRDPNGKILKRQLRAPYWSGVDRQI